MDRPAPHRHGFLRKYCKLSWTPETRNIHDRFVHEICQFQNNQMKYAYTFKVGWSDKNYLPVTAATWQPATTAHRDDTAFRSQVIGTNKNTIQGIPLSCVCKNLLMKMKCFARKRVLTRTYVSFWGSNLVFISGPQVPNCRRGRTVNPGKDAVALCVRWEYH